ncbi:hypothetical protein Dsin_011141 [Dipteronia sinensis]|uniref:Uncharacterized protein n=1 Tax=Dipteronia sinensis TaxID=43782 RepID=A0AAE0ATQ9_9ROSI|nr:hypothetical protein Dsin_011141 [Dipteronia sinensis]
MVAFVVEKPPNLSCRKGSSPAKKNKLFKNAPAIHDKDTPDQWRSIAEAVGDGTSVEEVKKRYEILMDDIRFIESDEVLLPRYLTDESSIINEDISISNAGIRLEDLKL